MRDPSGDSRGEPLPSLGEAARCAVGKIDAPQLADRAVRREVGARDREDRERAVGSDRRASDRDELLDVVGAHRHSPANELVSPTSRVLSSGIGSTAARATSAANSLTL